MRPDAGRSLALGTCPGCKGGGTPGNIGGYRILCQECMGEGVAVLSYMSACGYAEAAW